jgi:ferredoxin-NADP reductase
MSITDTLQVRVKSITWEADGILGFELCPMPPRKDLPAFTAGAHVDVHLPNGVLRSYSLLNSQGERHRYVIGVNKDAQSRGGSRYMHETLRAGDTLTIGMPRNNFPLDEAAPLSVFIAGGIGITPLRSMIRRMQTLGKPWRLHYAARTRQSAAFVDALQALRDAGGSEVHFSFDREPGGRMLDIPGIVAGLPAQAHVYCCGPLPCSTPSKQPPRRCHPGRCMWSTSRRARVRRPKAASPSSWPEPAAAFSWNPVTRSSIASKRSASSRPTRAARASAALAKCGC